MRTTREEALRTLGLNDGASPDDIRNNYKKLALQCHPDKNHGNEEATQKFQDVSAAYKKLTSDNDPDLLDDEEMMTWADMMELFRRMFAHKSSMHYHHFFCGDDDDDSYDCDYTDDECDDDDHYFSGDSDDDYLMAAARNRFRSSHLRRPMTESEALRNAEELIEQEEAEKQKEERKRAKRKKKKEKRKQREKEKKLQEEAEKSRQEGAQAGGKMDEKPQAAMPCSSPNHNEEALNTHHQSNKERENKNSNTISSKSVNNKNHGQWTAVSNGFQKGERRKPSDPVSSDDEQIDTQSAFFQRAASKAPQVPTNHSNSSSVTHTKDNCEPSRPSKRESIPVQQDKSSEKRREDKHDEKPAHLDPVVLKSREIAMEGNKLAEQGNYQGAVRKFSEAIELDRSDFRFFRNRSYCWDKMGQFNMALKDANEAISLAPNQAKGYFRKGRALSCLKRLEEAEAAFQHVRDLDPGCKDAAFELTRVRVQILVDMGFSHAASQEAIKTYHTVQAACEAILAGKVQTSSVEEEVYYSDDDEDTTSSPLRYAAVAAAVKPSLASGVNHTPHSSSSLENTYSPSRKSAATVPNNEAAPGQTKCAALWVGNVEPSLATEKDLTQLFSACGKVMSVRLLPAKYCAFVNYTSPESAALALEKLQNASFCGQHLLLRYPNNQPPPFATKPVQQSLSNGQRQIVIGKGTSLSSGTNANVKSVGRGVNENKSNGPVNGNECYFWRTTGCAFQDRCRYDHIPSSEGVDFKMKAKGNYGK